MNKNHLIERNYIHHVGEEDMHSGPVSIYGSNGNTIQYNKFATFPYAGVSIVGMMGEQMNDPKKVDTTDAYGSNRAIYQARWEEFAKHRPFDLLSIRPFLHCDNNKVQYNIIDDYMRDLMDGGAYYSWYPGINILVHKNVGKRNGNNCVAIYLDDGTIETMISGNVFWELNGNHPMGVWSHGSNKHIDNEISVTKPAKIRQPAPGDHRPCQGRRRLAANPAAAAGANGPRQDRGRERDAFRRRLSQRQPCGLCGDRLCRMSL